VLVVTTFALDSEFAPWRRLRHFRRSDGPVPIYESHVGSVRLRVVLTGVGQRAATSAAETVFRDKPDLCIVSGFAGGLSEALAVTDIIVPVHVSGPGGAPIACDRSALEVALSCGARRVDALYTAPAIVVTAAEKRQLSTMAEAVDMESRTILAESQQRNIPGLAVRAVSDTANVDLPLDLNRTLGPHGDINRNRLLAALLRRPKALPDLVRLGVTGYRAATALSVFLDMYFMRVAAASEPGADRMISNLSRTT